MSFLLAVHFVLFITVRPQPASTPGNVCKISLRITFLVTRKSECSRIEHACLYVRPMKNSTRMSPSFRNIKSAQFLKAITMTVVAELASRLHLAAKLIPPHAVPPEAGASVKDIGTVQLDGAMNAVTLSSADSTTSHAAGGASH